VMTTHGFVRQESVQSWSDSRSHCERNGLQNIHWQMLPGALPEKTRNEAARQVLRSPQFGWLLQIDADMIWQPDAIIRLLATAYGSHAFADVVGAYCSLRGDLALPTLDTGTGTWEPIPPQSGVLECMRTGAAFILVKRHVFENMADPWFRMRVPKRPIDALQEVDNYCRIKFDGNNPFRNLPGQEWERLQACAEQDPSAAEEQFTPAECGEDSGFCDRARLAGFRIFVDTSIEIGHVDTKITNYAQHKKAVEDMDLQHRYAAGLLR
jgi:hypothetical protein